MAVKAGYLRIFLVGLLLQFILQRFAQGVLPERNRAMRPAEGPQERAV